MSWWGDLVAIYAAGISTYTAFRWLIEERPYLTAFQPDVRQNADSITVKVYNPGRKIIFIVGYDYRVNKASASERLIKVTPRVEGGFAPEYAAHLMSGILRLAIAPQAFADFNIGPVYEGVNVVVSLRWHRAGIFNHLWFSRFRNIFNPLKVRATPELEALLAKGRTDLKNFLRGRMFGEIPWR